MHLVAAGLNHRTAPIELREKAAISEHHLPEMLRAFAARGEVVEAVILSTCNRTELYAIVDETTAPGESTLTGFLAATSGVSLGSFAGHTYTYRDERAAEHLLRVTTGLDSMILGEYQILGQVKQAYEIARITGVTGTLLNTLFQNALAVGKRVRTETSIGKGAFSVGSAAVELAIRIFGDSLSGKTVLVLGAGQMSELTARHLQSHGAPTVIVTNRTYDRAVALASELGEGASARHYTDLPAALVESDIVICSTAAPHLVITRDLISAAMKARRNRPLFLVDIAVPRDVDPSVGDMPNVYLYNIDDLSEVVARDQAKRHGEAQRVEEMIAAAVTNYQEWRRSLEIVPLVTAVRQRLDGLRLEEMARLRARLPQLSDHELRVIEVSLQSVTGKLAHDAISAIKHSVSNGETGGFDKLEAIRHAFGLAGNSPDDNAGDPAPSESTGTSPSYSQNQGAIQKAVQRPT